MKIRIHKDGLDWLMRCDTHDETVWCDSQETAYEAAAGHACIHHRRP